MMHVRILLSFVAVTVSSGSSDELSLESIEERLMRASEESNRIFNATHVALLRAKQRGRKGSHSFSRSRSGSDSDESDRKNSRSKSDSDESDRKRSWSRSGSGSGSGSDERKRPDGMPRRYKYWDGKPEQPRHHHHHQHHVKPGHHHQQNQVSSAVQRHNNNLPPSGIQQNDEPALATQPLITYVE